MIGVDDLISTAMPFDRPEFDVDRYLASVALPDDYDLRSKILDWRRDGVVVFENAVPDWHIDRLLEDIDALCAEPSQFDLEIEARGARHAIYNVDFDLRQETGVKFNCLETISLAARKLSLNRTICSFLAHIFQAAPAVLQSLTFWKGSNQPAHTDYPYVRTQTKISHLAASWIPLEDIRPDAGPLVYYPGSHRPDVVRPFDWGGGSVVQEPDSVKKAGELGPYLESEIARAGLNPRIFLPRRGDLLIWHGWLVHKGAQTAKPSLTRKSYVTHYTSLGAYPAGHMKPEAMRRRLFTRLHGGYVFDRPWVESQRLLPSWR